MTNLLEGGCSSEAALVLQDAHTPEVLIYIVYIYIYIHTKSLLYFHINCMRMRYTTSF